MIWHFGAIKPGKPWARRPYSSSIARMRSSSPAAGAPVPGFAQEARAGGLYALAPITGYPPETQRVYLALLKQTAHRDSQFPALVRAARGRMAVCLRTHEQDDGLAMLEALIQQIEREESG